MTTDDNDYLEILGLDPLLKGHYNGQPHLTLTHLIHSNMIESVLDPRELVKSVNAWNFLYDQREITAPVAQEVHRMIMHGLMPAQDLGVWRSRNVEVSGRGAPHFVRVPELMDEWFAKYRKTGGRYYKLNPKEMHIEFEHIHPFRDGNGRVGRMLMWYHEFRFGQYASLITYDARWEYYAWFDA